MQTLVGIYRKQAELERAVEQLGALTARAKAVRVEGSRVFNPGWHLSRDLQNLISASEAIARSALLRKESRGAHSRLDFPSMDPQLGSVNMCAVKTEGGMRVSPMPLPQMPAELKALFEPAKEKVG
jgi:succinate dehydrogenase / fumarate reductase flavoprotein subunit